MITAIFDAIAALPAIFGFIKSALAWIQDQVAQAEKRKLEEAFAKATDAAKKDKDTSGMDEAFDPRKKRNDHGPI